VVVDLRDLRALVTGATSGIGRATAVLLAERGAAVVVSGRDAERGAKVVAEIEAAGGQAAFVLADLADIDSVHRLAEAVGEVDVLVNNAGIFPFGPTVDQDVATFDALFAVNVRAPYFLAAKLAPAMIAKGGGSIINISSVAGVKATAGASVYSATKAALDSLTRAWAVEFSRSGIRVNTVAPGPIRTEGAIREAGDLVDGFAEQTLLGRIGDPAEVAEAVVFLASPRSSYVTGANLAVDGGLAVA
jgi:NAD(P)-dependent dehydrogenase (short-subunit alcohol dehydrogenase family)